MFGLQKVTKSITQSKNAGKKITEFRMVSLKETVEQKSLWDDRSATNPVYELVKSLNLLSYNVIIYKISSLEVKMK